MGNRSIELPPAVVCDRCNGGVLSVLDQTLLEFFPVKLRRTELGIESKAGKVPETAFQEGRLRHNGVFAALHGELKPRSWTEEFRLDSLHTVGMATISGGRPLNSRHAEELSRAVLKVGFGCAWLEQGDKLLRDEFNTIRQVLLGMVSRSGFLFVGHAVNQRQRTINVRYDGLADPQGEVSLRVLANVYGVVMLTDSRPGEPSPGLDELGTVVTFGQT
jgi:hypothetical protein